MPPPDLKPVQHTSDKRPLVSIVMPTYQRPHLILESIQALLEQTCADFELLIQDDSPSAETERAISFLTDCRIRYQRNPVRLGMPGNLNAGISRSRGVYILVCHDHDLHDASRLQRMLTLFEQYPQALFVHTGIAIIDQEGRKTANEFIGNYAEFTPGTQWLRKMLAQFSCPVAADTLVCRSTYERHGLYDPDYGFISDVEMWMRLSLHGGVGYLAESLSLIREREIGHEYEGVRWDTIDAIARIHRLYCALMHRKSRLLRTWHRLVLEARLDKYVALHYLACVKHRDRSGKDKGRQYLRRTPFIVSRLLSRVVR